MLYWVIALDMGLVGYASDGIIMGRGSETKNALQMRQRGEAEERRLTFLLQMNPNPTT